MRRWTGLFMDWFISCDHLTFPSELNKSNGEHFFATKNVRRSILKYYSDPGRKFIYTAKHLNTGTYEWKFNWNTSISNYSSNIRRIEKIKISVRDTRTTSPVFIRSISVRLSLMSAWFNKWRINKTCQFEQNWHFRRQIYQVNISGLRGWLSIARANSVGKFIEMFFSIFHQNVL